MNKKYIALSLSALLSGCIVASETEQTESRPGLIGGLFQDAGTVVEDTGRLAGNAVSNTADTVTYPVRSERSESYQEQYDQPMYAETETRSEPASAPASSSCPCANAKKMAPETMPETTPQEDLSWMDESPMEAEGEMAE